MKPPDQGPVRFSQLKVLGLQSPAHYAAGLEMDSGSIRKGSALHSFLIGDPTRVRVYDGRRDPRAKAYQDFLAKNEGCEILIASEMVHVNGMRRSIERHRRAMELLDGTVREQRIEWETMGRACAGTPDVVHIDKRTGEKRLVELKTSKSSRPEKFKWQGHSLAYHAQVAWYADGLKKTTLYQPGPVVEHTIVVVESSPPYPVTIVNVRPSKLKRGRELFTGWLELLLQCERANHFPSYVEGDVDWEDDEGDMVGLDFGETEAA